MSAEAGRVLVVEDNADALGFMAVALEQAGFAVETASDGLSALKLLKHDPPSPYDVLVLDLVLPWMNGLEVMAEMHADPALRDLPILIVTATVVYARQLEGLRRVSVLHKPFTAAQLTTAVDALLYRRVDGPGSSGAPGIRSPRL